MRYLDITLMYCGSLASVRSPEPASPYPVSGFIVHVAVLFSFWLKLASTVLSSVPRPRENCRPFPCSSKACASYFRTIILQKPTTSPCSHHGAPERVEEVTLFCTAAWSNGVLPTPSGHSERCILPFTDVGWKAKGIHTTHTIRAQSHWHGFCRTTKTAVAPQSCMCTIPWLRTILLHDRAINLSKTKAHVHLDSILCLGKIDDHLHATAHLDGKMEWFMKSGQCRQLNGIDGERVELQVEYFPRTHFTGIALWKRKDDDRTGCDLNYSEIESSSCRCTMASIGRTMETFKCVNSTLTNTARTELHSMITFHHANTRGPRAAQLRTLHIFVSLK